MHERRSYENRELKPGYNLQIATNDQYVVGFEIFPNPGDSRTLRPFLESLPTLSLFKSIVADAEYGSVENYAYLMNELEKEALIPHGMYRKEQTKAYKNDPTKRHNCAYDEVLDCYVDHDGVQFSFSHHSQRTDKSGFTRDFKVYKADKTQASPELDTLVLTPSGHQRTISINAVWDFYKKPSKRSIRKRFRQTKIRST